MGVLLLENNDPDPGLSTLPGRDAWHLSPQKSWGRMLTIQNFKWGQSKMGGMFFK
jgi:hypothetical protein